RLHEGAGAEPGHRPRVQADGQGGDAQVAGARQGRRRRRPARALQVHAVLRQRLSPEATRSDPQGSLRRLTLMRSRRLRALGSFFTLALFAQAQPADAKGAEARAMLDARIAQARAMLKALFKGDFKAAGKDFDDAMKKALGEDKLKEVPGK